MMPADGAAPLPRASALYGGALVGALALVPLLAVLAPRALAFWPGAVALPALVAFPFVFRQCPRLPLAPFLLALGVTALAALSTFWSIAPDETPGRALRLGLVLLSGALLYGIIRAVPPEILHRWRRVLPAGAIIGLAVLLIELALKMPVYKLLHGLPLETPLDLFRMNRASVAASLLFFPALGIILFSPKLCRPALLALALAMAGLQLLTDSQSANVAFVLGLVFLFAFPAGSKVWRGALCAALCAMMLAAPWIATFLFDRLAGDFSGAPWLKDAYAAHRCEIWDFVARYALQNPLYGFGLEATREVPAFDSAQIYQKGLTILHPHNFAIQIWIEFGLLGALLACGFFCFVFARIGRLSPASARMALAVFMAGLAVAATGYGLWQGWWLGAFFIAASWWAAADKIIAYRGEAPAGSSSQ